MKYPLDWSECYATTWKACQLNKSIRNIAANIEFWLAPFSGGIFAFCIANHFTCVWKRNKIPFEFHWKGENKRDGTKKKSGTFWNAGQRKMNTDSNNEVCPSQSISILLGWAFPISKEREKITNEKLFGSSAQHSWMRAQCYLVVQWYIKTWINWIFFLSAQLRCFSVGYSLNAVHGSYTRSHILFRPPYTYTHNYYYNCVGVCVLDVSTFRARSVVGCNDFVISVNDCEVNAKQALRVSAVCKRLYRLVNVAIITWGH